MIFGLAAFLLKCSDEAHLLDCGGFDPADCPRMPLSNFILMLSEGGLMLLLVPAGLTLLFLTKRWGRPVWGFLVFGVWCFWKTFQSFPRFCS